MAPAKHPPIRWRPSMIHARIISSSQDKWRILPGLGSSPQKKPIHETIRYK
jgi:hypothetical protein